MLHFLDLTPEIFLNFFLLFLRVSGIFFTAPIVSAQTVPRMVRIYMTLMVSLILFNVMPTLPLVADFAVSTYFLLAVKEVMVGMLLGIVPRVFFAAVDFAGTIISFQMGLSVANVLDPQSELQVSIIASFKSLLATLLFVTIDGHHWFFEALATSYEKIPLGGFNFYSGAKMDFLLRLTSEIFVLGLQLSGPILVALLLANLFLGLMARSIPQLNVFVVGFPLTIGMGFILLVVGMPYMVTAMLQIFQKTGSGIIELMNMMAK